MRRNSSSAREGESDRAGRDNDGLEGVREGEERRGEERQRDRDREAERHRDTERHGETQRDTGRDSSENSLTALVGWASVAVTCVVEVLSGPIGLKVTVIDGVYVVTCREAVSVPAV